MAAVGRPHRDWSRVPEAHSPATGLLCLALSARCSASDEDEHEVDGHAGSRFAARRVAERFHHGAMISPRQTGLWRTGAAARGWALGVGPSLAGRTGNVLPANEPVQAASFI